MIIGIHRYLNGVRTGLQPANMVPWAKQACQLFAIQIKVGMAFAKQMGLTEFLRSKPKMIRV